MIYSARSADVLSGLCVLDFDHPKSLNGEKPESRRSRRTPAESARALDLLPAD
jgi:hypothetical protein